VARKPKGAPYFLDSLSIWCQHTDHLYYFPCYEWLDETEAASFIAQPSRLTKKLTASSLHAGMPPPPPGPPTVEVMDDPFSPGTQLLVITCAAAHGGGSGLSWRVQCVQEDSVSHSPAFLDILDDEVMRWRGGAGIITSKPRLEANLRSHVKLGGQLGLPAGAYLWRVCATHPLFGEGPFSTTVRYEASRVVDSRTAISIVRTNDVSGLKIKRPNPLPLVKSFAELRHAFHFAPPHGDMRPGAVFPSKRDADVLCFTPDASVAGSPTFVAADQQNAHTASALELLHKSRGATVAMPVTFEDAVQPKVGRLRESLLCVGEAEVWRGALELTPLRKGIGICGAAWFHRPLAVDEGFETEFIFTIDPATDTKPDQRGSDGFAFVLQADERGTTAIGASGIQLGYGGLSTCFAVQFATQPSCAERRKRQKSSDGDAEEGLLCTLPEPHDHIFLVPPSLAEKECICPFTGVHFIAPRFVAEDVSRLSTSDYEYIDLSHHKDKISVQSAGVHANSSGPEASLASADLLDLDDGVAHTARIVLERNRFFDARLLTTDALDGLEDRGEDAAQVVAQAQASALKSYRLLVYVDNLYTALIDMELNLGEIFGELDGWDGNMFAGFTAGTGKRGAGHTIRSWSFHEIGRSQGNDAKSGVFFGLLGGGS
jgi:hypothetical protein